MSSPRSGDGAGLAPLHKPTPEDLLTVAEMLCLVMPLRDLRTEYLRRSPPNMPAVDAVDKALRRVVIGALRLRGELDIDLDALPSDFMVVP